MSLSNWHNSKLGAVHKYAVPAEILSFHAKNESTVYESQKPFQNTGYEMETQLLGVALILFIPIQNIRSENVKVFTSFRIGELSNEALS